MESPKGINELLKSKYSLHKSPEVDAAAQNTQRLTGEKVAQNPLVRIQNYLDRINTLINPDPLEKHPEFNRKERNLNFLKDRLHDKFVIKPAEIPESYWENQRRIARERGQGDLSKAEFRRLKKANTEAIVADQKSSLDKWTDYFTSPDSSWVPDVLKYYAFRSVLTMGEYDKDKHMYPQRSKGTTKPFPDLNHEALAYVIDALDKKYQREPINKEGMDALEQNQFERLLEGENFAKLYAFAIEKVTPSSSEQSLATVGTWIKYGKGSDHKPLVKSIQGHGTGWCTAAELTAKQQLRGGDFYVYYSNDSSGKPIVPRVAIRMEGNKIAEVRGVAENQNLDEKIIPVVDSKLEEFPDGALYKKKVSDMRLLTELSEKTKEGQELTRAELRFIYEIDTRIDGFGYGKDPRVAELRAKRNLREDLEIVLEYGGSQIAESIAEINQDTKVYVGNLEPGIFNLLDRYRVEHVYTQFPEGRVRINELTIGQRTSEELMEDLKTANVKVSEAAGFILRPGGRNSYTYPHYPQQTIKTYEVRVGDMGFVEDPTLGELYTQANVLGLHPCPPEVGVTLRLKDQAQPTGDSYNIGMYPEYGVEDESVIPSIFSIERRQDGLWLHWDWTSSGKKRRWTAEKRFVFCNVDLKLQPPFPNWL